MNITSTKNFLQVTAKYDDWELFFRIENLEIGVAKKIEAHIKRMKSKIYIQNLTKYPEMVEKLVARYRDDSGSGYDFRNVS